MDNKLMQNRIYYIFSYPTDYYEAMFSDILGMENVVYIKDPVLYFEKNILIRLLYRIAKSRLVDKFFHFSKMKYWYKYAYKNEDISDTREKVFIFLMCWLYVDNECFLNWIKKYEPQAKYVAYFEDIVSSRNKCCYNLSFISSFFNLLISYDKNDAERYNMLYYPTFLSRIKPSINKHLFSSDVCFVGAEKKRHDRIIELYNCLRRRGYSCDFCLARYSNKYPKVTGIHYIKRGMQYVDYISHLDKTNCIVEIQQEGATGYTLRTWEALIYGKKMITDNKTILSAHFYNPDQFCYYDSPESIPDGFLKSIFISDTTEKYIEELSARRFISFIDNNI